jgi:hypothetical protein
MKLTKQKLEQLIMEEYVRSISHEDKPTNYPQHAGKLTALAKDDPIQARSLADTLDEPLDVEYDPNLSHKTMQPHRRNIDEIFNDDHMLHFEFFLDGGASSLDEEPDQQEVYEFAERQGLDPQETYDRIMSNYKKLMMRMFARPETPSDKMRKVHGITAFGE